MPIKPPPLMQRDLARARDIARSWKPLDQLPPADIEIVVRAIAQGIAEGRKYGLEIWAGLPQTDRSTAVDTADGHPSHAGD